MRRNGESPPASRFVGYAGEALEFLKTHDLGVGDEARIEAGLTYEGRLMPRYEGGSSGRLVVKLRNGYNVGVDLDEITGLEKKPRAEEPPRATPRSGGSRGLSRVLLLSTGGTISSTIDYRTGAVTPAMTPEELNASVPELSLLAEIEPRILFSEYSENLQPSHWREMALALDGEAGSDYRGIIMAHGTDTMQYTASYLSFALSGFPVPVVLVGSQRSSDRPSSDAATNLIAACKFIGESRETGVYVAMHRGRSDDEIACHVATRVRKNHTSRRGAFQTIGGEPAFVISEDGIRKHRHGKFFSGDGYDPRIGLETKVALIKYHPGYDPGSMDHLVDSGYRGIIFEGTGLGHIGDTMYESVRRAASAGVFMGMTSQCLDGRVRMTVYESGRDLLNLGIVPLENMIPETALVKLMWALGNFDDGEVENVMLSEIASEFG